MHFNIQQKKKKIFTITTQAYLWITVLHTGQIQKTGSWNLRFDDPIYEQMTVSQHNQIVKRDISLKQNW